MENKPKYLISIYKDRDYWGEINYYSITVADINRDRIVESITKELTEDDFKKDLKSYVDDLYPECTLIFNNEDTTLVHYLKQTYKDKLLTTDSILNRRLYGWTPSKNILDKMCLKGSQEQLFTESFGAINYYLDLGYGRR